jgi:hypothetical protein
MFMKLKSSRGESPSAEMNDGDWHEITNRHRCLVVPRLGEANNLIVKPSTPKLLAMMFAQSIFQSFEANKHCGGWQNYKS